MKIAFLITLYKQPDQANVLIHQLVKSFNCDIYIHLDKKSKIQKTELLQFENVHIINQSVEVKWGAFGMTQAMITLLQTALNHPIDYEYYIFRTGQDLLIKKGLTTLLNEKDETGKRKIYMDFRKIKVKEQRYSHLAIKWPELTRNLYDGFQFGRILRYMLIKLYYLKINILKNKNKLPPEYGLYWGRNWFALPDYAALYIKDFLEDNAWYEMLFRNALAPDELFFQTILLNSRLKGNIVNDNLTYVGTFKNNHPEILRLDDYNDLVNSNKYFARKFDLNIDETIVKKFN